MGSAMKQQWKVFVWILQHGLMIIKCNIMEQFIGLSELSYVPPSWGIWAEPGGYCSPGRAL